MAKLIVSVDGQVLDEVELVKERTMIGRKPHNDVRIENLAVSGEHAAIVTILNDSFLEDLGSTNGTTVNGHPIKKHFLQNNDLIEIGKYKLKYINEKATATSAGAADFEKTMVLRPNPMRTAELAGGGSATVIPRAAAPLAAAGAAPAAAPAPMPMPEPVAPRPAVTVAQAAIQILTGPSAGKELDLVKNLTTLGKPGVQVAVITRRPHGYFLTHVEGGQYPVVNGVSLDAQPRQLNDHDIVELAGVKMEFFFRNP